MHVRTSTATTPPLAPFPSLSTAELFKEMSEALKAVEQSDSSRLLRAIHKMAPYQKDPNVADFFEKKLVSAIVKKDNVLIFETLDFCSMQNAEGTYLADLALTYNPCPQNIVAFRITNTTYDVHSKHPLPEAPFSLPARTPPKITFLECLILSKSPLIKNLATLKWTQALIPHIDNGLCLAAALNNQEAAQTLIEVGATFQAPKLEDSPIAWAEKNNHPDMKLFLEKEEKRLEGLWKTLHHKSQDLDTFAKISGQIDSARLVSSQPDLIPALVARPLHL